MFKRHRGKRLLMDAQFDETKYVGPEHLDPDYVSKYDAKARTDPTDDVEHLKEFGLSADSVVVDLGAGSGTFAAAVSPDCKKVIAVDVSPAMRSVMKAKIKRLGRTNVEIVEAGFLSFEAPVESVDIVYSRHALHQLPDHLKAIALKRISQMLKPLGVLYLKDLVYSFSKEEAETYLKAWLDAAPAHPEDGWTKEELETHIKTEFSSYSEDLEAMLNQAGFEIRDFDHSSNKVFSEYTCLKEPSPYDPRGSS